MNETETTEMLETKLLRALFGWAESKGISRWEFANMRLNRTTGDLYDADPQRHLYTVICADCDNPVAESQSIYFNKGWFCEKTRHGPMCADCMSDWEHKTGCDC
jgi:hypothetical protein